MIGETLEDADDVLGATVSIKRGADRLQLWTKTARSQDLQVSRLLTQSVGHSLTHLVSGSVSGSESSAVAGRVLGGVRGLSVWKLALGLLVSKRGGAP